MFVVPSIITNVLKLFRRVINNSYSLVIILVCMLYNEISMLNHMRVLVYLNNKMLFFGLSCVYEGSNIAIIYITRVRDFFICNYCYLQIVSLSGVSGESVLVCVGMDECEERKCLASERECGK